MELKQDFSKTHAILCNDGYEFRIRCLKRAIHILECVQAEDRDEECSKLVYPLGHAIEILSDKMWQEFDDMCSQKADYDNNEWLKMKNEHIKRAKEQKTKGESKA